MNLKDALIKNDSVVLGLEANTWEEAVKLAVEPLVKSGAVEERYYDAIIRITNEFGPYYLLMPGMAMPHARPEDGVNESAFSLITLKNPVTFSDGKEARVLIALAAESSEIHASVAIPQIIALLELEDSINRISSAKTKEEIYDLIDLTKDSPYLQGFAN